VSKFKDAIPGPPISAYTDLAAVCALISHASKIEINSRILIFS
jgi:hypothetical protein